MGEQGRVRISDDDLGRAWRGGARRGALGSPCPEPDALFDLAAGALDAGERELLTEHVARCSDCADEYRLVRNARPAVVLAMRARPRSVVRSVALAASLLVALGISVAVIRHGPPTDEEATVRGAEHRAVTLPLDGSTIARAPARLAWQPKVEGQSYRFVLYDRASTPLWESGGSPIADVDVPVEAQGRLVRGRSYLWRVFVKREGEEKESPLFSFTIEP